MLISIVRQLRTGHPFARLHSGQYESDSEGHKMHNERTRRQFLELGAAIGVATALGDRNVVGKENTTSDEHRGLTCDPIDIVRIGLVGIGGRGYSLLRYLLGIEGLQIMAVGDLIESRVAQAQNVVLAGLGLAGQGWSLGTRCSSSCWWGCWRAAWAWRCPRAVRVWRTWCAGTE